MSGKRIPKLCTRSARRDAVGAGWHAVHSIVVTDTVPDWRLPGGGIREADLTQDLSSCLDRAIMYAKQNIVEAESHLIKLRKAKEGYEKGGIYE